MALGLALRKSGYTITEIVGRETPGSRRCARLLARKVGARARTVRTATLDADLLWFCVPDREIRRAAEAVAPARKGSPKYAFHSSGALLSRELDPLRERGTAVASVHPLMTFVAGSQPPLEGVPFALEGDPHALRMARHIVRDLGGDSFPIGASRKPAYHAWATFTSPLWLAFLVTLEEAAGAAGLTQRDARLLSQPILRQTLQNYLSLGPGRSFSGPLIRGDVGTVAKHLAVLWRKPRVRNVYSALVRMAMDRLPTKNKEELTHLLKR
jgi:predicted short-subunit dehydrogenase-like oxidoreductase (DUF2520 family)